MEEQGLAGGLLNVSFQFGSAIGLAIVTAVNVATTSADGSPEVVLEGFRAALVVPVAAVLLDAAVVAIGLVKRTAPVTVAPSQLATVEAD